MFTQNILAIFIKSIYTIPGDLGGFFVAFAVKSQLLV